jgi:hypothetical protein
MFKQALNVFQDRGSFYPEKARALYKRSKVYAVLEKPADGACDRREALRLYRLSQPSDKRLLDELDDSDFDNIIIFWSQ